MVLIMQFFYSSVKGIAISRDYHTFSSANHLNGLMTLRDVAQKETRQMISIYSNMSSEVFGKLKAVREESRPPVEDEEDSA